MDNTTEADILQHLYLSGVRPNGKEIGVGAYGRVFEVEFCGHIFAAKEIHSILVRQVRREESEAIKGAFLNECVQSLALGHPNVVTFLGVYNPDDQSLLPILVMERMQESLTSLVEKYPSIPMYVKLSVLLDVSQGLWYLHSHHPPIVHRDLSPNNVLLNSHFVAKISDLGVAKVIQADNRITKTPRAPGTIDFMPPEALQEHANYGVKLDVFSYGGIILHVVNQEWPTPLHYVITNPKSGKRVALSEIERRQAHIEKMSGTPINLKPLVDECLEDCPGNRPSISDISERIKRMKETQSTPHVTLNPNTWQRDCITNTPKNATITPATTTTAKAKLHSCMDVEKLKDTITWEKVSSVPVCCTAHTAVSLHGNVYVGGGSEECFDVQDYKNSYRLDIYNPTTNQWSSPITTPYSWFAMTILDSKLLIAGGININNKDHMITKKILVLKAGHWEDYSEMPSAKYQTTAVGYKSMLIIIGGTIRMGREIIRLSTIELLDTTNGFWYTCNSLPSPSCQLKATVIDEKLYLLGGFTVGYSSSQIIFASLDTISNNHHKLNWQSLPNCPWHFSSAAALHNKFLLTLGGRKSSDITSQTREVCILNPSTGLWECITNIPEARSLPAVVGMDDKIVVIGGTGMDRKYSNNVWVGYFK